MFDTIADLPPQMIEAFRRTPTRAEGDCRIWGGTIDRCGYGNVAVRDGGKVRHISAHRLAYIVEVGPIPAGRVVDHLCRVRACVNTAHLEPVTSAENTYRGVWTNRDSCVNGHEFTPENTLRRADDGTRSCRECRRQRVRAFRSRQRAAQRIP